MNLKMCASYNNNYVGLIDPLYVAGHDPHCDSLFQNTYPAAGYSGMT